VNLNSRIQTRNPCAQSFSHPYSLPTLSTIAHPGPIASGPFLFSSDVSAVEKREVGWFLSPSVYVGILSMVCCIRTGFLWPCATAPLHLWPFPMRMVSSSSSPLWWLQDETK